MENVPMTNKNGKSKVSVHPTRVQQHLDSGWTKDLKTNKVKTPATGSGNKD